MSGLDFPDDGRAVGSLDWDLDGDMDVWITNRNAPRLRLMRNDTQQRNHFIAIQLIGNGTTVNRDAIGARVEIMTADEPNAVLAKTLRAGDAFLAQSSKWVHFGLGKHGAIKLLRVRWPDGSTESFGPVSSDRRYRITQSSGQVERWESLSRQLAITPRKLTLPEAADTARVPLVFPLRVPKMAYRDFRGREVELPLNDGPVLINLWASWCRPCIAELQEFKKRHHELADVGVNVIGLSVDRLSIGPDDGKDVELTSPNSDVDKQLAADFDLPFATGRATQEVVATLQLLHDLVIHSRQTLPIPTTMLVNKGRLVAIYKGELSLGHVFADLSRSEAPFTERKMGAAMVAGTIIPHELMKGVAERSYAYTLFQAGLSMRQTDRVHEAIDYFTDAVRVVPVAVAPRRFLADTLKAASRFHEAASAYQAALQIDPELADVHFSLANTQRELEQFDKAVRHYKRAIALEPDYFEAHRNCAIVLAKLGRIDASVTHYQEAIRIRPNSVSAHLDLATILLTAKRLSMAEKHFGTVLRLAPNDADAHSGLGTVFAQQKRYTLALRHFESTVRLRPKSAAAHTNLGNVLKLTGRFKEAARVYQIALQIAPDSAETHNNLGAVLQSRDRFQEAITHYRAALQLNPQLVAAQRNWGRALQLQGRFEEALPHFEAAVRIKPDFQKAVFDLGQTQLLMRHSDRAVVNLEKAVELAPNDAAARRELGRALVMQGRLEIGIEQYQKSLQLKPNDLQTLNNLAWLLATCEEEAVRDGQQAVKLARRAAELSHFESSPVLDTLAAAWAEVGAFEEAVRWQARAIELLPDARKAEGRVKLERYESKKPIREPRRATVAPTQ